MTIGKVTVPLLIKRSDLVAQLVNLTSVCIKKMCTEKKNHLIEGRRRELKVCKRREKKREGGNFSLLDLPPPPSHFRKTKFWCDELNWILWFDTSYLPVAIWASSEKTRRKYKRDWEYDKISCRIKLAQNSLYYSTTPPIRPSKENEKWCD